MNYHFFKDRKNMAPIICFFLLFQSCRSDSERIQDTSPPDLSSCQIEIYLTSKDSEKRLSKIPSPPVNELQQPDEHFPTIMIDPQNTFQIIEGFGGALTDASAETFYELSEENREKIVDAYFDKETGIGYTLCRTSIHSCDFSSISRSYAEIPNDTDLKHFSIENDRQYRIPLIKDVIHKAGEDFKLLASPWSPPAWMKTNGDMLRGGKLLPEFSQSWANYYVKFIEEYTKENIPVWGITVQNEPMAVQTWESCIYTAEEEKEFVKNFLGPAITHSKYPDTKILIWDHNRGIMYQRAQIAYNDPEASKYIWGTGFHWYMGNHFENVKLHREAFPDKKLLFTEGCVFPFNYDSIYEWHWGERYGESIIHDLNNGAVGWIDWNILLDETGGPNHTGNFCFAPIIANTKNNELHFMNSYYYLGHFSKYIRPGAKRIACSSNDDHLLTTSFINPDNSIIVVVLNRENEEIIFRTWMNEKCIRIKSPAHSILTVVFR